MEINVNQQTLKDFSYGRKFVRGLASRSIAPVMLLEAFVEGGRTYQAYKRGGFTEARERLTEEMLGAACWFSGVPLFSAAIDRYVGKKMFKLPVTDFHTEKDELRNPVKNYINKFKTELAKSPEAAEKMIARYKFGKVMTSIILANCLVGLALPKFNQAITKYLLKKKPQEDSTKSAAESKNNPKTDKQYSMDEFLNKNDKKDVAFGMNPQTLMSLAYAFENNPKYGLLSSDLGVWVGRSACARNEYERTEVLFRDISSSYFYMFNMPVMAAFLNKLQDGNTKRLDPVGAKQVTNHLEEVLKANGGSMDVKQFKKAVLGVRENEAHITPIIQKALNKYNGVIKLSLFEKLLPNIKSTYPHIDIEQIKETARKMSDLQPAIASERMISAKQIKDVLTGGAINMPEFLKNIFRCATSDQNLFTGKTSDAGFNDEFTFISRKTLENKQQELVDYVETIIKKAKDGTITKDLLKKVNRENYIKNAANWGIGFAISAAFLSTFIPKIQYWITKKATGSDAFPGTAEYDKK